jgi:soluble lytic murein transglycosylase-like protein
MTPIPYYSSFQLAQSLYGVPWPLLAGIARVESGMDPKVRGPLGEMGLMQIAETTWKEWGKGDPLTVKDNILCAARYLRWLIAILDTRGRGEWKWALYAYNWGIGKTLVVSREDDVPPQVRVYAERVFRYAFEYAACEVELLLRGKGNGKLLL